MLGVAVQSTGLLAAGVVGVLTLVVVVVLLARARRLPGIPSPEPFHWFFGHHALIMKHYPHLHDWKVEFSRKAGPTYGISLPTGVCFINTRDAKNVQYVLKDNFDNYEKGEKFRVNMMELLGDGIFNTDGEQWKRSRKLASHMFTMKELKQTMMPVFHKHGRKLRGMLEQAASTGKVVDLQQLFFRFTMDAICEIAFGFSVETLDKEEVPFAVAFDRAQERCGRRFWSAPLAWRIQRWLQVESERQLTEDIKVINDFVYGVVRERQTAERAGVARRLDLLSRFITEARERGEELSEKELRDIVLNFMIAGRDTTACLLTWLFYELSLPERASMSQKFVEDVLAHAPEVKDDGIPSYEAVNEMDYVHMFVQEVLRLHPPVPSDGKFVRKADVLPDGTIVPLGSSVGYSPYEVNRDPSFWGEDCMEFRPERFLEKNPTPFEMPTFNAGPRLCLGKHVALLEAKVLASMLAPRFEFVLLPNHSYDYKVSIILVMRDGMHVRVKSKAGRQ